MKNWICYQEYLKLYQYCKHNWNVKEGLLDSIWKELKMIRIYTKPKGSIPDVNEPVIMKKDKGCTVNDFCLKFINC